jgi:AraC-like DNA-binding protein
MQLFIWFFFSMAAGIGFFWSFLLFFGQSKHRKGTRPLALLLFTFALTLTHYVLVWSANISHFPHLSGLWIASNYLYGPLLLPFFVITSTIEWRRYIWHFVPFLILLIAWLPFGILPGAEKILWIRELSPFQTNWLILDQLIFLVNPFVMVGVQAIYAGYFWFQARSLDNGNRKLRMQIATLFSVFILAQLSYFLFIQLPDFKVEWDYMISLAMTFCILGIAYASFNKPEYFFKRAKPVPPEGKYNTSPLSTSQSSAIAEALKKYLTNSKAYLDPELRLASFGTQVHYSKHQISQAINETYGCSFSDWVNQYRIQYACDLLSKGSSAKEAAYQSGFNSISNFYAAFKKAKGLTPAKFAKTLSA